MFSPAKGTMHAANQGSLILWDCEFVTDRLDLLGAAPDVCLLGTQTHLRLGGWLDVILNAQIL